MLEVRDLRKSYGKVEVLKGVDLTVDNGEIVAVIGPSGSGKSTLLRCINRLEKADSGYVTICGETMMRTDERGRAVYSDAATLRSIRQRMGFVFQNFNLFPHMTVLHNITEAQVCVLKRKKQEARENALRLLEKMGLESKASSYPCELSGGQQQRVSIARALALDPEILFFDEPTSALDPELTGEILNVIRKLAAVGMTMVIVTHEMAFAHDVADKVIFMESGSVADEGTPDHLFGEDASERVQQFMQRFSTFSK